MYEFYCRTPIVSLRAEWSSGGRRERRESERDHIDTVRSTLSLEREYVVRVRFYLHSTRVFPSGVREVVSIPERLLYYLLLEERESVYTFLYRAPGTRRSMYARCVERRGISLLAAPSINTAQQPDLTPACCCLFYRLQLETTYPMSESVEQPS